MYDTDFNDQVRSFVESIEPDFRYQGTDGLLSIAIESAENVMTINAFIEADEEKENFLVRGAKTVGGWIKTAIKKIIEFIKKAIAKIKSVFLSFIHKIKSLYASALEKIGKYLNSKVDFDNSRATVSWYKLQPNGLEYATYWAQELSDDALNLLGTTKYNNTERFASILSKSTPSQQKSMDEIKSDTKVFEHIESQRLDKGQFTTIYNGTIMKSLNKAYTNIQKINAKMISLAAQEEKKLNGESTEEAKQRVKDINTAVGKVTSANTRAINQQFSIAIFAFHQALKATLFGLKGTIGAKIRAGRNKVADKISTDESFSIEGYDDMYEIL